MILDDERAAITRRRSSVVATYQHSDDDHVSGTDCFVHQLLDGHKRRSNNASPLPTPGIQLNGNQQQLQPQQSNSQRPTLETINSHSSSTERLVQATAYFHESHGSSGRTDSRPQQPRSHASRHLNKKQLSDMAFSIRELSKTLAHVKLRLSVHNIFILGKVNDDEVVKLTRELSLWLLERDSCHKVYVEDTLKDKPEFDLASLTGKKEGYCDRLRFWDNELCRKAPQIFDLVLLLGGDGTVLYASWLFQKVVPPVLAFSLGSLGFLTKFDFNNHKQTLETVFDKGFNVSLRLRFEATIMRKRPCETLKGKDVVDEIMSKTKTHDADGCHNILNELVVDRGPNGTMSTLEVVSDMGHITTVQADGICVATPTGSTAYNLAAGGSLCHPDNPVVLLTAICAHTLSFRPIILPDTIVLKIAVPYDARASAWASFDGRERVELKGGDYVTISASRFPFPSVMPSNAASESWIDSISRTLNWNNRQRQKAWSGDENKS